MPIYKQGYFTESIKNSQSAIRPSTPSRKTASKNNLIALLDMTSPGVNNLFDSPAQDDGSQKWGDFAKLFGMWIASAAWDFPPLQSVTANGARRYEPPCILYSLFLSCAQTPHKILFI